ncbi:uncharacterized protein PFL1_02542 [Pseudozyma flocculosa PF-1]|nr:uncharacterized protein PFL1_02542 [Pseudozyma flocculosa PF-1]EPQ29869.1 hypothetical protein PFL1_02542 [Pseudozyma flocculosa PF-1]
MDPAARATLVAALDAVSSELLRKQLTNILINDDGIPCTYVAVNHMPDVKPKFDLGPHLINAIVNPALTGALLAASGVYFFHFSGKNGDRWFLQAGVAFAVVVYVISSIFLIENFYTRILGEALGPTGWPMTSIGWQVATVTVLVTFPMALGQLYFLARTSMFFTQGKKLFLAIGAFLVGVQVLFGLLPVSIYIQTLDYVVILRSTVMREINDYTVVGYVAMIISNEVFFSVTLLYKLHQLRRHSSLAAANAVMYKLGILAIQSNVFLIASGVAVLLTHQMGSTGWFLTVLIAQHPLHALFVVANLLYRPSIRAELEQGVSDRKASLQTPPFFAISVGDDIKGRAGDKRTSSTAIVTARAMAAAGWKYEVSTTTSSKDEERADHIPLSPRAATRRVGEAKMFANNRPERETHLRQTHHYQHHHHHLDHDDHSQSPLEQSLRCVSSYSDEERSTTIPADLGADSHALAPETPWSLHAPPSLANSTTTAATNQGPHLDHDYPLYDHPLDDHGGGGDRCASPKPSTHYSSNF